MSELEESRKHFAAAAEQAQALTAGLTEAQFNWRPAADAWSIEECLAHMILVGNFQVKALERAIEEGKSRGMNGQGPFRYGMLDRYILGLTEASSPRKFAAPKHYRPLHQQPITGVLPSFLHLQSQFIRLAESSEGLDLARVKVRTPISRFLRLSLGMMFQQIAAHERRHIQQAQRVREQMQTSR